MSRIAKAPVDILSGVEISIAGQEVTVKGKNGTLVRVFNDAVEVVQEENQLVAKPREGEANGWAQSGTARSLLNNMINKSLICTWKLIKACRIIKSSKDFRNYPKKQKLNG